MRVAHICQSADPNVGGSLIVAQALVREQLHQGIDAQLVCLYGTDNCEEPYIRSLNVGRRSRWRSGIAALRDGLKDFAPDVIHHHDGILWPRVATSRLSIPLITHGHLGRPVAGPFSGAFWTHRFVAAHTDRLIAISEWVAKSWKQGGFPGAKIRMVPNGVDAERFFCRTEPQKLELKTQLGLPVNRSILLWVGRLDRETKGLDRLVALARVLEPNCVVVVVGDGPDREWLRSESSRLAEDRRPILAGKVPDPSLYFGAADAFLLTSRAETFGLVILEAADCGLPIFAFPCEGGGSELLTRCKATMIPEFPLPATFGSALAKLKGGKELAAIAADTRANFSWKATASAIAEVYRELVVRG